MKCPTCKGAGKISAKAREFPGCHDCRRVYATYMVRPAVWEVAVGNAYLNIRFLCLHCLERRLGRALTIDDFTTAPINDGVFLGHALGVLAYAGRRRRRRR